MKTIHRSLIPEDYTYYRTGSRVFLEYFQKCTSLVVGLIGKGSEFFIAFHVFPGFWSVTVEKQDTEIDIRSLRDLGVKHGLIYWTPMRRTTKPRGWWRVPAWFTRWNIHSSRSAFSILDRADYWNKWSSSARSHRRHVLENLSLGVLRIDRDATIQDFLSLYVSTKLRDPHKDFVATMTKKLFSETDTRYRVYIAYVDDCPLGGAVFIDESATSEYWASFYHDDARPYHLGIAIMDVWFLDSYEKGIKYCDLDHMRDVYQSYGFAGYTKFKESIADHDVYFHDMWFKIF